MPLSTVSACHFSSIHNKEVASSSKISKIVVNFHKVPASTSHCGTFIGIPQVMRFRIVIWLLFLTVSFLNVYGCGVTPAGQEKTISFTLSDFKLRPEMVHSDMTAKMKVSSISTSKNEAEEFVRRLIRQGVEAVLYQQGRSAFLADNVIDLILQQLNVQISYDPLQCDTAVTDTTMMMNGAVGMMKVNCIINGDIVTNICMHNAPQMCKLPDNAANFKSIESKYMTLSGSLITTNAIMANWSTQMWQNVLNRVLRSITSNPSGSNFYGASVKLN